MTMIQLVATLGLVACAAYFFVLALHVRLVSAVRNLYYAGVWSCDRPADEKGLWTAVRDAAGFPKGQSPKPIAARVPHDEMGG